MRALSCGGTGFIFRKKTIVVFLGWFSSMPILSRLKTLDLARTRVGDRSMEIITRLSCLEEVDMSHTSALLTAASATATQIINAIRPPMEKRSDFIPVPPVVAITGQGGCRRVAAKGPVIVLAQSKLRHICGRR